MHIGHINLHQNTYTVVCRSLGGSYNHTHVVKSNLLALGHSSKTVSHSAVSSVHAQEAVMTFLTNDLLSRDIQFLLS